MAAKPTKKRLDILLAEKGIEESRSKAQALIMAGLVEVNGVTVTKPGTPVKDDALIRLKERNPYVSRGGLKLEGALKAFNPVIRDRVCMDVGASTGGFTDCLLQNGARKVYAIDVGRAQLHPKLRNDPRVASMEGVNFRYFSCGSLKDPVEFVTIDVSFISLDKILPVVAGCLVPAGEILAMVKPQFEADRSEIKKGVVRDEAARQKAIGKIRDLAARLGLDILGGVDSPVKGPEGNVEHFLWLRAHALKKSSTPDGADDPHGRQHTIVKETETDHGKL